MENDTTYHGDVEVTSSIQADLQAQLEMEMTNFRIYKHLSGVADKLSLTGACKYFQKASAEELTHYNKIYEYMSDRGMLPLMNTSPMISASVTVSLAEIFAQVVLVEKETTANLLRLKKTAFDTDFQTFDFLDWFLYEQTKSEKEVTDIYNRLVLVGENGSGIILIDQELAEL